MTDELDDIKKLLSQTPPVEPSEEAKNTAIFKAMEAFDKKPSPAPQGISFMNRLIHEARDFHGALLGGSFMKKGYILAGGIALGILAVALLNTSQLTQIMPIPTQEKTAAAVAPSIAPLEPANVAVDQAAGAAGSIKDEQKEEMLSTLAPLPAASPPAMRMEADKVMKSKKAFMGSGVVAQEMAVGNAMPGRAMYPISPPIDIPSPGYYHDEGRDKFSDIKVNPIKVVKEEPVSTFSVDVDTSSYSFMRASLNNNALPQADSVRVEELINYFPYEYEAPKDKSEPFKATVSVFPTPWNAATKLVHIGIKGYQIEQAQKPHSNLVFLLDTSGSMNEPNKLPLVVNSMKLLLDGLSPDDTVAIVTYAGNAGTALEPTKVKDKAKILTALDGLGAGGSTAGAEGIRQAYQLAESNFDKNGVNRVILATDGDFNVGITDPQELKSFVERKRQTGIFLSVLGFGRGNYNDELMQLLAQNGNGNAAYIDNLNEARKVLVEEASATLFPIAKDVKIQVEFNPAEVAEYRLIGYETRMLNREDFNNDKIDAGEIGAGHAVTAIYEITPVGSKAQMVDDLRYGKQTSAPSKETSGEYGFLKIRYKLPDSDTSKLITTPVDSKVEAKDLASAPQEARFAASVAAFGQILRGDAYTNSFTYDDVIALADAAKGKDTFGYRAEFINLTRLAKTAATLKPLGQQ